jgi:hypothetical protein
MRSIRIILGMPFSLHVDEGRKVIHISAEGGVTNAELMALINRLRREPALLAGYPILYDSSAVTDISINCGLIQSLATTGRGDKNLVAIIAPGPAAFGLARMYQKLGDVRGNRIQVFTNADDALVWLGAKATSREGERKCGTS